MDYNYSCSCHLTVGDNDEIIGIRRCTLPDDQCCAHPTDPHVLERDHEATKAHILEKYGVNLSAKKSDLPAEELHELRGQSDMKKWSAESKAKWWEIVLNWAYEDAPGSQARQAILSIIRDEKVSRIATSFMEHERGPQTCMHIPYRSVELSFLHTETRLILMEANRRDVPLFLCAASRRPQITPDYVIK